MSVDTRNSRPLQPFPPNEYLARIKRLTKLVAKEKLDAFIILSEINRFYFTGFHSSNAVLLIQPGREPEFYTDFRYLEMARRCLDFVKLGTLRRVKGPFDGVSRKARWRRVGFEGRTPQTGYESLRKALPDVKEWVNAEKLISGLRAVKSAREQAVLRRAVHIGDDVFRLAMADVRLGMSEWDIRRLLRYWSDKLAQNSAFGIVCVGSNASECHHAPGERILRRNQEVLVDMGVTVDSYVSDMTRTVFFGKPSKKLAELYKIVLEANKRAIRAIRAGQSCARVDAIARKVIEQAGYGKQFGHGLGHGVGLEVHEAPGFSALSKELLKPGNVMTVEPGIYLPGVGGVRIEDMVIVHQGGCEVLTRTPKRLTCY
ncbi:M24 family metallopeptidase [Candidatus Sumerlaeota bacterium]